MKKMVERMTGLLVGALLVLTLGGCGADGSAGDDPSTGAARVDSSVRERLAAGLAETSRANAEPIEDPDTTLTPMEVAWLHGWQIFDIDWQRPPGFHRFYAALSDDGKVLQLSGDLDAFTEMVRNAQVMVDDASLATDVGNLYLDATRTFEKWSYRIDSISDVNWLPVPDASQEQQRDELEVQYATLIQPPAAEPSPTGWSVTVWMVSDRTLVRHNLEIAADGAVQDNPEVLETDILVPYSV